MKIFLSLVFLIANGLFAQTSLEQMDPDELFLRARDFAFSGQRDSARMLLRVALKKSPTYVDLRVLYARTFAWDGRRSEAREELKIALQQQPKYKDALQAAIDVEIWDEKFNDALTLCNTALRFYPNDEELLVKRITIYRELNREGEALLTISILESINPSNPNIRQLRESIKTKSLINSIEAKYTYDWFSGIFNPQHLTSLQYSRSTPIGLLFARANIVNRFNETAAQYEIESYPLITDGMYGFVNYGYSGSILFQKHRAGFELFSKFPENFEASLGIRYLYFRSGSSNTIYTGALGYYFGSYWFSFRPYITSANVSFSRSFSFTARRYFDGNGDFFFAKFGAGFSPDERFRDTTGANLYFLKAQTAGVGVQYSVDPYSLLTLSFDYTNQELSFSPGNYMKVYSLGVGYKYKF